MLEEALGGMPPGSCGALAWTATFLHASHNLFIQGIFTPLTGDTGPTRYAVDEFGFVLPLVIGATAVWFWRKA